MRTASNPNLNRTSNRYPNLNAGLDRSTPPGRVKSLEASTLHYWRLEWQCVDVWIGCRVSKFRAYQIKLRNKTKQLRA